MACFSGENEKYRTIEINLGVQGYRRMVTEESRALYLETGNCSYLQVLTRLVILTAKEGDYVRAFYMTIVPSRKYLELTDFKPFIHNGYFQRDSRFDGLILYHEIDGTFINGWEYEDGKIWYAIQDMADSEVMTLSSGKCLMTYEVTCTDWYYTVNGEDPVYNGTTCGNPVFVKMVCGAGLPNLSELSNIKGGGGVIGNQMQDTITNTNTFFRKRSMV